MNNNTYWNGKGEAQAMYDEMEIAGFKYTKKSENVFFSYYNYYNNGVVPGWTRRDWWRLTERNRCYIGGRKLNEDGEKILEDKATEAIRHEYMRFEKAIGKGTK